MTIQKQFELDLKYNRQENRRHEREVRVILIDLMKKEMGTKIQVTTITEMYKRFTWSELNIICW